MKNRLSFYKSNQASVPNAARIILATAIMFIVMCLQLPIFAQAREGDLDTTFGVGGRVLANFFQFDDYANKLIIQPDAKIIVIGDAIAGSTNYDFLVARYNSDGSIDSRFGNSGVVTTDFFGTTDDAFDAALQPDGKIIAVGYARISNETGDLDFALARYNSDGSLDTTFGRSGKVTTDFFGFRDEGRAVILQPDGKIIVCGSVRTMNAFNTLNFALARYNSDGSLDTSFGTDGRTTVDFFGSEDEARDAILQPDGKILVAGTVFDRPRNIFGEGGRFALARYNSNGTLDASFGIGGKLASDLFGSLDELNAIALQTDGKIVAAGSTQDESRDFVFLLVRYESDGKLDGEFGKGGKVYTDFSGSTASANGLVIQKDSKIVVAGGASDRRQVNFVLARYQSNGKLDKDFGVAGKVITEFPDRDSAAYALALQSDGRILAAGQASVFDEENEDHGDLAITRYVAPPDFEIALEPSTADATMNQTVKISVTISRSGDLASNITVTAPDTRALNIKVKPQSRTTTGESVNFKVKIKSSTPIGTHELVFTGRDDMGHERIAIFQLMVR